MEYLINSKIALLLFAPIIAAITWALFKIIPDGKLKVLLFRVRDGSDKNISSKEKKLFYLIAVFSVITLYAFLVFMLKAYE